MDKVRNITGFTTLLGRECHRFLRLANQTLIPPVLTAVLFVLIFGYSLGSRIDRVQDIPYMQYIVPGLVMMGIIGNAYANTSSSVYISRFQGHIQEILVSSLSSFEAVLALVLGGVFRGLTVGVLVTAVCSVLTGVRPQHPLVILYFTLVVSFIFSSMGFIAALWAQDFDRLSLFQTYLLTPLTYLGGVFFSVQMLPGFWRQVALVNPILYCVNGLRYGFLGVSDVHVGGAALLMLLLAVGVFSWCVHLFHRGYNIKT